MGGKSSGTPAVAGTGENCPRSCAVGAGTQQTPAAAGIPSPGLAAGTIQRVAGRGCGGSANRHPAVWSPNADPGPETRAGSSGRAGKTPQVDLQTRNLQPLEGRLRPGVRYSLVLREARSFLFTSSLGGLCAGKGAAKNQARFHLDERRGDARSEQLRGLFKTTYRFYSGEPNSATARTVSTEKGRV